MSYNYNEPDYFFGSFLFGVFLLFVFLFAGLFYHDHLDDQRAKQCIEAGKNWVEGNCLTP